MDAMMEVRYAKGHLNDAMRLLEGVPVDPKVTYHLRNALAEVESEERNGWSNHETWALNLWLSSDPVLFEEARKAAKERGAEGLREYVEELFEMFFDDPYAYKGMATMIREVGSLWRVAWDELAEAFAED